ncbi:hypothetical protein LSH36_238g02032 [Paralvinella palmiformis]|uniref:Uncharacterized protein n=1 Tax=Paralvinella palmiformis TaxID=53620 RepID=A0AAD9N591_9ANNE|nr:hypothetical protein LSH36_238g02032 [Paralvinella palmiformis]
MECENKNAVNMLNFLKERLTRLKKSTDKERRSSPKCEDRSMHRSLPVRYHLCKQCHDQRFDSKHGRPCLDCSPAAHRSGCRTMATAADPGQPCHVCKHRSTRNKQHLVIEGGVFPVVQTNGCIPGSMGRDRRNDGACFEGGRVCVENGRVTLSDGLTCSVVVKAHANTGMACMMNHENGRATLNTYRSDAAGQTLQKINGRPNNGHQRSHLNDGRCHGGQMTLKNGAVCIKTGDRAKQVECCQTACRCQGNITTTAAATSGVTPNVDKCKTSVLSSGTKTKSHKSLTDRQESKQNRDQRSRFAGKNASKRKEKAKWRNDMGKIWRGYNSNGLLDMAITLDLRR